MQFFWQSRLNFQVKRLDLNETMFKNLFIFSLCAIFVHVHGWLGIIEGDPNTAHLGDCYDLSYNLGAMTFGEVKRLEGKCAIATCKENRDIRLTGCAPIKVRPPKRVLPGDLSKPFPQCCHEIVGPENNTETSHQSNRDVNPTSASSHDILLNERSNLV